MNGLRAAGAVVVYLLLGAIGVVMDDPVTPALAAAYALVAAYFVADAFDRVREHPAYHLANTAWTAIVFALLYLGGVERSPLFLALAALAVLGTLVEAYNYRFGTSHLRIDT